MGMVVSTARIALTICCAIAFSISTGGFGESIKISSVRVGMERRQLLDSILAGIPG